MLAFEKEDEFTTRVVLTDVYGFMRRSYLTRLKNPRVHDDGRRTPDYTAIVIIIICIVTALSVSLINETRGLRHRGDGGHRL